jgi:hypothetical protein
VGTTLRRSSIILIAALALSGCSHYRGKVEPWVWPGANRFNTLAFAQSGTTPERALRYVEAWDAEWFDVSATEPVPAYAHTEHRPLVADLDRDGHLEIVTSPLAQSPATILNLEGAPLSGRARDGMNWDRVLSDLARIIADDSAGWVLLPEASLSRPGSSPMALRLNQRVVTLQVVTEPGPLFPRRMLECRDGGDGRLLWQYEFRARPDVMAAADLDSDGKEELLVTTYGEEDGVTANGTRDRDSCFCVALRDDGTLLWQRGFGAHPFIGCSAGVADLDQNGKPDVFVAVYSWLNDFGELAVLDGATGAVMAELPGRDSSPVSCVSAGCADVDGDGRQELAVAVCGKKAELRLYRLAENRLMLAARAALGEARDSNEASECRLHAICDLDGDGKCELVVSRCRKRMICKDPMFYPSTFDSCGLLILGSDLQKRQEIPLPMRCQDVTLGDVIPGGNIELLVITDRLRLYSTEAE